MSRDRIYPQRSRSQGYKLKMLGEIQRRIELLADLSKEKRALLQRLENLWRIRESQYFSFSLAWLMLCHGSRLYATDKRLSFWFLLRRVCHYLPGIKLKRLLNREAYTLPS